MSRKYYTTSDKALKYDAVIGVFPELFKELKELGKKKPEITLSLNKINLINRVLEDVRILLNGEPDHKYLDILDADALPQYGDAILCLNMSKSILFHFRNKVRQ
jgi:hypothetical protein